MSDPPLMAAVPSTSANGPWDDSDIFRGGPPPQPDPPPRSPSPSRESTTSTSSSGSYFGRLGAIAAVVELAISRWAGNESSGSSSSSSDSHSVARSRSARRSTHRSTSEHAISTRITRMQAREESRQIPRQFALYLPPSLTSTTAQRIIQTISLSSILGQLDTALKKSIKAKRQQERERSPRPDLDPPKPQHLHFMLPDVIKAPSRAASFTDLATLAEGQRKGKQKEGQVPSATNRVRRIMPKAWFLDVSSPTWEDMRAIGKLLHLHPLTLEDILMQDPREKLEHFPKLGYYFLSFRAIESWNNREKYWDQDGDERDEGLVREANVYLIVFNEGVCSFHFTDISDHIDRVRNRIILLERVINMTSDWIAHGILDSIVDSFFPFLEGLEREVVAIEDVVFSGARDTMPASRSKSIVEKCKSSLKDIEKTGPTDWPDELSEKNVTSFSASPTHFSLPWPPFIAKWRIDIPKRWKAGLPTKAAQTPTASTLHRMARARRLVTSLSRLLAAKSEVVAQLRKRLMTSAQSGASSTSGEGAESVEVAIYLGDVQDHILTLENALGYYERMLSQSHPLYISHVRTTVSMTKGDTDKALMFLSILSIAVLCIQTLIGLFSINVTIPANTLEPGGKYNMFGIVLALAILILSSFLKLVHHWWKGAKRTSKAL
ncbi:hypothetical protein DFH07DRAFT_935292 [Mycena maculata]|uniref:Uncharacterized protein n=1 Tax=Mycena maculata TaxID=230809 RepID=A0AAD7KFR7_9AGAR|nr:hypothetical protein DFH07DRAFT_935292 [Mycena maculata]